MTDWEYKTTTGPRKAWNDYDEPPEGEGWELDPNRGRPGESWDRFDYHEERYWRRRKPAPEPDADTHEPVDTTVASVVVLRRPDGTTTRAFMNHVDRNGTEYRTPIADVRIIETVLTAGSPEIVASDAAAPAAPTRPLIWTGTNASAAWLVDQINAHDGGMYASGDVDGVGSPSGNTKLRLDTLSNRIVLNPGDELVFADGHWTARHQQQAGS